MLKFFMARLEISKNSLNKGAQNDESISVENFSFKFESLAMSASCSLSFIGRHISHVRTDFSSSNSFLNRVEKINQGISVILSNDYYDSLFHLYNYF